MAEGSPGRDDLDKAPPARTWWAVFACFARIGATAFGGGSATLSAMRRAAIKNGWLDEQEFLDTVVLSRLTPGITILAQVLLIGKTVCGIRGMVAGIAGMLTPAVAITIALARLYDLLTGFAASATPLRCVLGAAAGFTAAVTLTLFRDTLKNSHRIRGPLMFLGYLAVSVIVRDPLIVIAIATLIGVVVPGLFKTAEGGGA